MDQRDGTPADEPAAGERLRTIGGVAEEVGLTARAIRYYEEVGLLRPAVRVKGSSRLFDASDVQRLREIKRLREVIGFSLAEIAELLDADDVRGQLRSRYHGTSDPAERARVLCDAIALAERRLGIVERKLGQVEAVRQEERQRLEQLRRVLEEERRAGRAADDTGA
ncbi:MAG TPA: MerR family transcriptional regulator [Thermomicrobiaceae bacterium]|nr:MerR family transcriptional regulator [Thermomicrobiaceae bacterium]